MQSAFSKPRKRGKIGTKTYPDEVYDMRGLNTTMPDQVMKPGESPYTINSRMYAREEGDTRVAIRSRRGSTRLSTPVGETIDDDNTDTSTGEVLVTETAWVAEPFVPTVDGALTKLELEVKVSVAGGGHLIVEIYSDDGGAPGTLLAQGSINSGTITGAYQYLPAYFIEAPELDLGVTYWHRERVADGGTATYALNRTAAAGGYSTVNPGGVYTALGYTWRFKSYLSTPGEVLGFMRRYPSDKVDRTLFAMNENIYAVTDAGVATSINADVDPLAEKVRFAHVDDKTIWVDGLSPARWWDGTAVTDMANVAGTPTHVIIHQNRSFFVPSNDPTRVNFSGLYDFESYRPVDFFYVPNPKSRDWIAGWRVFQDNLVILTHETKHIILGTELSNFTRKEAIGTKGAVSDEAIAVDRNYIYFMADDKQIYRFNGVEDEWISDKIETILNGIQDTSKVRFHLYNNQLRIYFPSGVDTVSEDMLLLELSNKESNKHMQWFHDTGRAVCGSLEWNQDNNQLIEFSSKVGAMYNGEIGNSDLGKAIDFKYWTAYKGYGSGSAKDRVKRFRPYVRPSDQPYTLLVGKDIDFANKPSMTRYEVNAGGATWGNFNWNDGTLWGDNDALIDDKVAMSGRGKFTQYRFECSEVEASIEIYGYIGVIKSGRIR